MSTLEQELVELGGDIATALEELLLPATLLDANGIIRWQNGAARALRDGRVGSDFVELVAPDERAEIRTIIGRILKGEPAGFTVHVRRANGDYARVQSSAVPVRGEASVVAVLSLGHSVRSSAARAGPDLTPRQIEVLRLLADGRSTAEIAARLSLSSTTVRNHVAALIAALGAHTRLQAVVTARRAGLLDG